MSRSRGERLVNSYPIVETALTQAKIDECVVHITFVAQLFIECLPTYVLEEKKISFSQAKHSFFQRFAELVSEVYHFVLFRSNLELNGSIFIFNQFERILQITQDPNFSELVRSLVASDDVDVDGFILESKKIDETVDQDKLVQIIRALFSFYANLSLAEYERLEEETRILKIEHSGEIYIWYRIDSFLGIFLSELLSYAARVCTSPELLKKLEDVYSDIQTYGT